jgi:hypothetical protein
MGLYPKMLKDIVGLESDARVFCVDPDNGDDTNTGDRREQAFATMQAAIDACVDSRGDRIIRYPGTENITAPILCNKEGITIEASSYGAAPANGAEAGFSTYPAASYDSGPTVIISKPCTILGLEFVTRNVTSAYDDTGVDSGAVIVFIGEGGGETGGFSLIKHCRFVDWWGNDWGIEFAAGAYNTVEDCVFESFTAGILFRGTASNNPESNIVQRNIFKDCTYGIEHKAGATCHNYLYFDNKFIDSKGVDFNAQASDGLVAGNWYETATDAATYDETVGTAQGDGVNFSGNHYSE